MTAAIHSRELSPVELVDGHLKQIERHNPRLNAFVMLFAEQARDLARASEQRQTQNALLGPLDGIPITVKDSFDMAGLPASCGSRVFQDRRATEDSTAVPPLPRPGGRPPSKHNLPPIR